MSKFCFECNNEYDGEGDMCPVCGNRLGASGIQAEVQEEKQRLISCMIGMIKPAVILLLLISVLISEFCNPHDRETKKTDYFEERYGDIPSASQTHDIDRSGSGRRYDLQPTR